MKTASFFTFAGEGRVSIARYVPRGTSVGFQTFGELAPGPWFNRIGPAEYRRRFDVEVLGRLDPGRTWDRLHQITGGAEPVLLCWERPPWTETHFCHRRIVAEWFHRALGFEVLELTPPPAPPRRADVTSAPLFRTLR